MEENKKKKIIIFKHPKGCRLANQLWNFVSIYAYCLENGCECRNYSFFEDKNQGEGRLNSTESYYQYFNFPNSKYLNFLFKLNLFLNKISNKFRLYYRYVNFIERYEENKILSDNESVFYLPPSGNKNLEQMAKLSKLKNIKNKAIYFNGWMFRNPKGIEKHRKEIIEYFKPKKSILKYVNNFIKPARDNYKHIVGVHIRQRDYKKLFENGRYYFNEKEVRRILDEYLNFLGKPKNDIIFLICSDEAVEKSNFEGLNYIICNGNAVQDLFTLASCDIIIGSDSTFGSWASYYGNIPIIIFERNGIDWDYYKSKDMKKYFENKKCALTHY